MGRLLYRAIFLVPLSFVVFQATAYAEIFLGEEAVSNGEGAKAEPGRVTRRGQADAGPPAPGRGDISLSGGLGAGAGHISGQLTIGYGLSRYTAVDTTLWYYRYDRRSRSGEQYGPEVDFVLRFPNPTILTPIAGIGPGYVRWERSYEGESFDADHGWTANAFAGLNISLTRHFGLQLIRKQTRWLTSPPKSFDDRSTREPRISIANAVGFHLTM